MAPLLSDDEARAALEQVPGWHREADAIVRDLECPDFATAIAFVNRVADAAESLDHHPDILVHGWNKVRLTSSTHSEGGLTAKDFVLAAAVDAVAAT